VSTATKILESMQANPKGDWQLEHLQTVARQHGIDWRHKGSSHCVFTWANGRSLAIPSRRPVKPIYVMQFVQMLLEV